MRLLTLTYLLFLAIQGAAQYPYNGLIVSEVDIPDDVSDAIELSEGYSAPPRCWHLKVCVDAPYWEVQAIYGYDTAPWVFNSTAPIYQSPVGSEIATDLNPAFFPTFPTLEFDSWFAIGNAPYAGTITAVTDGSNDIYADFESGLNFNANTSTGASVFGAWLPGNSEGTPDAANEVLIMQFTAESGVVVSGVFNVQLRRLNPDLTIYSPTTILQIEQAVWDNVSAVDVCSIVFLPLTLTSFTAHAETDRAALRWSTESEQNVSHFEIERTLDGENFTKVNELSANGNTSTTSIYYSYDFDPQPGNNYYRLKIVDTNGAVEYSDLRRVEFKPESAEVYPNPANERVTISGVAENVTHIRLLDATGSAVQQWDVQQETATIQAFIGDLPAGMYLVELVGPQGTVQTERLVIQP